MVTKLHENEKLCSAKKHLLRERKKMLLLLLILVVQPFTSKILNPGREYRASVSVSHLLRQLNTES